MRSRCWKRPIRSMAPIAPVPSGSFLELFELYLQDLVGPRPAWGSDLHRIALALADQGPRDRRGKRDAAVLGVRFHVAHDLIFAFFVGVLVHQGDGGAELDAGARQFA